MYRVLTFRRCAPSCEGGVESPNTGHKSMKSFINDDRGTTAMIFGLTFVLMMGFVGASVDIGRWLLARKQTQDAIDTAVLAGLRRYQNPVSTTNAAAEAIAAAAVNYNYSVQQSGRGTAANTSGGNPLILTDTVNFVLQNSNTRMTATGGVTIATPFISAFTQTAIKSLPVLKTDGSENAIADLQYGSNAGTNLEVSMMIDITGSMGESDNTGSTKIATVKTAAASLVDIIVWPDQTQYTSRVAVVPFSETVNLGSVAIANMARGDYTSGTTSSSPGTKNYQPACGNNGYGNNNCPVYPLSNICVTERTGSERYTDSSPISFPVGPYYSTYGTKNGTGVCPTQSSVLPLSSDKTALKNLIGTLSAGGGTAGQMGTAWAWYMLSPNFSSLWPASAKPGSYDQLTQVTSKGVPVLRKIAILMTDGDYNTQYCGGINTGYRNCNPDNDYSGNQAAALCTSMKAKGIEVYTIGAQVSSSAKTFLTNCATDANHYYDATDGTKLQQAFIDIAYKLVPPYISH